MYSGPIVPFRTEPFHYSNVVSSEGETVKTAQVDDHYDAQIIMHKYRPGHVISTFSFQGRIAVSGH